MAYATLAERQACNPHFSWRDSFGLSARSIYPSLKTRPCALPVRQA